VTSTGCSLQIDLRLTVVHHHRYRLHVGGDPLLFEGGAVQTWRNGDVRGCPWPGPPLVGGDDGGDSVGVGRIHDDTGVVNATSLVLMYEW
jgi:hypothetical protein